MQYSKRVAKNVIGLADKRFLLKTLNKIALTLFIFFTKRDPQIFITKASELF